MMYASYRASIRSRLRKNGYSFFGAWAKCNTWNAPDHVIDFALSHAQRISGIAAPSMPVGALGDGQLFKQFIDALEKFFASPLGQALEQVLIKLLLGLIVV